MTGRSPGPAKPRQMSPRAQALPLPTRLSFGHIKPSQVSLLPPHNHDTTDGLPYWPSTGHTCMSYHCYICFIFSLFSSHILIDHFYDLLFHLRLNNHVKYDIEHLVNHEHAHRELEQLSVLEDYDQFQEYKQ